MVDPIKLTKVKTTFGDCGHTLDVFHVNSSGLTSCPDGTYNVYDHGSKCPDCRGWLFIPGTGWVKGPA